MYTYAQPLNDKYFNGQLADDFVRELDPLKSAENPEVHHMIENCLKRMQRAGIRPQDLTADFAAISTLLLPAVMPKCWQDSVPQFTKVGRHNKIDTYVAGTFPDAKNETFLDIGCGFPPLTTIDTANTLKEWNIVGADAFLHPYVVYDRDQSRASIDRDDKVAFFQSSSEDIRTWHQMYGDQVKTRAYFQSIFEEMKQSFGPVSKDGTSVVEIDGRRLIYNPIKDHEQDNLRFVEGKVGEVDVGPALVVRAFNIFIFYDRAFMDDALNWAAKFIKEGGMFVHGSDWTNTSMCRSTVYRKQDSKLRPTEFMFTLDNLRPVGPFNFGSHKADDQNALLLTEAVHHLRQNDTFAKDFDAHYDQLLSDLKIGARQANGYMAPPPANVDPKELADARSSIHDRLSAAGYVKKAVDCLNDAGLKAWINPAELIGVDPYTLTKSP